MLVLRIAAKKRPSLKDRVIPAANSILNWLTFYGSILLFLLYFSKQKWLFYTLYTSGDLDVTMFLIIVAFMIVSLGYQIARMIIKFIMPSVYDFYDVDRGLSYTLNRIIYYLILFAALAFSFSTVGLDLTAIGAIFGVLGIGIGFGMRNIAANFVSGIIILFERPIEIGEMIQLDGKIGKVERIRLRSTIVRTAKEGTLIVPNQHFIEQVIKNRTGSEMMASVTVSITYGTDTEEVERLLKIAVEQQKGHFEGILDFPEPDIRFVNFRDKALDFLVEVPVVNFDTKEKVESRLRHSIAELFWKHGIELASAYIERGEY
ncbi:mechanosensitive ion channel [Pseudalkalibacillus caeni]|uniref:Mechanosensitive ion channel n=2 Tax=Exobacillus caeni TaxID=2574798 RepID=A0A5R9F6K8_9BACL|nr:mechanosensitive ion channel [Pseudalkalibacillus caeni]